MRVVADIARAALPTATRDCIADMAVDATGGARILCRGVPVRNLASRGGRCEHGRGDQSSRQGFHGGRRVSFHVIYDNAEHRRDGKNI